MCGIVGYKGKNNAIEVLINGLETLEYRGYDSAGIAYLDNGINIIREVGKISNLKSSLPEDIQSNIGIAHTRWATHGKVSKENAHPHRVGKTTIVHNGIIENYEELRNKLINEGYTFNSQTDTEVLCALIDSMYNEKKDMLEVLKEIPNVVKGSYATLIMHDDEEGLIYATRFNSPLILAKGKDEYFFASDVPAILKYTNEYILLDQNDIVKLDDTLHIYDKDLNELEKEVHIYEGSAPDIMMSGYEHFMLKEINDEPGVIEDIINYYITDGKLNENMPDFKKYNKIFFVACGSAYYTSVVMRPLFEKYLDVPVTCYLASEYRYQKLFYDKDTLVVFISQSGETADTLEALRRTKNDGIDTLAIVNVMSSSIAREAHQTLYIKAGIEIAVATTKAFSAQLALLGLILIKMSGNNELLEYYNKLPDIISKTIDSNYEKFADKIYNWEKAFFIGRGLDYGLCEEGSLKLKEISYITAQAYPSGELKHGTISLIEKDCPVISIICDDNIMLKTISNVEEVHARGAYSLVITNKDLNGNYYHDLIKVEDVHEIVNPILLVIPLQLIAYYVAKKRGCDIDKPRNLAKSVTVE